MKALTEKQDFLTVRDGQELFYRVYRPTHSRGSLILVHGLGEHSGRYKDFSGYLAKNGWTVYLYDQRGHGKTPGPRGYVDRFQDLVDDLHYFMEHVSRNGRTAQPYVMGHSFGGQVVINFLAQHPKEVPGAVLSSPNIKLVTDVPWLKRTLGKMASRAVPYLRVPNEVNPEMISHDIEIVRKYRGDKLVQNKITLRLGAELLDNLDNIMELAPKIKTPCLIFHGGGDRITSPEASENFFKKMKVRDREMKIYPGFYHETLNEIGKERVYQDVATWLSGRI